ncbi:hypothetical protein ACSBR1_031633 [Camellia fascicularis]
MEISQSPGHLLLLKLLQREEHLCARRITIKETRKDTIGREIFQLCFFFFIFHSLFSIILFTSTTKNQNDYKSLLSTGGTGKWRESCRKRGAIAEQ